MQVLNEKEPFGKYRGHLQLNHTVRCILETKVSLTQVTLMSGFYDILLVV